MTRRRALALLLGLALAACTPRDSGRHADEIANGGDPLPKLFERGRGRAIRILEAIAELRAEDFPDPRSSRTQWAREFYAKRRIALRDDIRLTPNYVWVPGNGNRACGSTRALPLSPIQLSYRDCRNVQSETDAAEHLIGESVHHLGINDDASTALLAVAVRNAWIHWLGRGAGGTELRELFGRARLQLVRALRQPLMGTETITLDTVDTDWKWLMRERERLAERVTSREHVWIDDLPPSPLPRAACAETPERDGSVLHLAYQGCESVRAPREAERTLLDVELRAAGLSAEQAERLTTLYFFTLSQAANPDEPVWKPLPTPERRFAPDRYRPLHGAWTGKHFVAWGLLDDSYTSEIGFWRYAPQLGSWSFQRAVADPEFASDLAGETVGSLTRTRSVGVGARVVLLRDCAVRLPLARVGSVLDLALEAWRPLDASGAPKERSDFRLIAAGDRALVWGGQGCLFSKKRLTDGAWYDPATGRWDKIPAPPDSDDLEDPHVLWSAGGLIFWGGCRYAEVCVRGGCLRPTEPLSCSNRGWRFDEAAHAWRALPSEGSPVDRPGALTVAAGRYVIVYDAVAGGARFDLQLGRWQPIRPASFPFRELIWAPPHVLAIGSSIGIATYSPYRNQWVEFPALYVPAGRPLFWIGSQLLVWDGLESVLLTP